LKDLFQRNLPAMIAALDSHSLVELNREGVQALH